MAANDMAVTVLYSTGSMETITAPDLSYSDGYVIQDEYVDISNPDNGVFWDRNAVDADHAADVDATDPDELDMALNPFGQVHQRICVVSPEVMALVEAIYIRGVLALVRDPSSTYGCGLSNVLVEQMLGTPASRAALWSKDGHANDWGEGAVGDSSLP